MGRNSQKSSHYEKQEKRVFWALAFRFLLDFFYFLSGLSYRIVSHISVRNKHSILLRYIEYEIKNTYNMLVEKQ